MADLNFLISVLGGNSPAQAAAGGLRLSAQKPAAESFGQVMERVNARMSALKDGAGKAPAVLDSPVRGKEPVQAPAKPPLRPGERTEMKGSAVGTQDPSVSTEAPDETAPPAARIEPAAEPATPAKGAPVEELLAGIPADEDLVRTLDRVLSGAGLEKLLNVLNQLMSLEPEQGADLLVQASGGKVSREEALAFLSALRGFMDDGGRKVVVQELLANVPEGLTAPSSANAPVKGAQATSGQSEVPPSAPPVVTDGMKAAPREAGIPQDIPNAQVNVPQDGAKTAASDARTVRDLLLMLADSKAGRVVLEVAAPPPEVRLSADGKAPVLPPVAAPENPVPPRLEAVLNLLAAPTDLKEPPVKPPMEILSSAVQVPLKPEMPAELPLPGMKALPDIAILKAPAEPSLVPGAVQPDPMVSIAKLVRETLNPAQPDLAVKDPVDWAAFAQNLSKEAEALQKPVLVPLNLNNAPDLVVPSKPVMVQAVPVADAMTGKGVPEQASLKADPAVMDPLLAGKEAVVENVSRNMPVLDGRTPDLAKPAVPGQGVQSTDPAGGVKTTEASALRAAVRTDAKSGAGIESGETLNKAVDLAWAKTAAPTTASTLSVTPHQAARGVTVSNAPSINPAEVIQQIAGRVESQLMRAQTVSRLSFQLIPESLGRVTIQVAVVDQTVSARIVVGNPDVRDALQHHMVELRTSLNQAGLQIDNLQVHVQAGSNGQGLAQYFEYQHEGFASDVKWAPEAPPAETPEVPVSDVALAWGRMNLVNVLV